MRRSASFIAALMALPAFMCSLDRAVVASEAHASTQESFASPSASRITPNAAASGKVIVRYERTKMDELVYYTTPKCDQSPGSWSVNTPPKYGEISYGFTTGKLNACPGKTFTFAAIYYKWTAHNNKSKTDFFVATWRGGPFVVPVRYDVEVLPVRPIGEESNWGGWVTDAGSQTIGNWYQTLTPPKKDPDFDFSGEMVREVHGPSTDSCTNISGEGTLGSIPGSTEAPSWPVKAHNSWGPDQVGRSACSIAFFRCVSSTPCGYNLTQFMEIHAPSDDANQWTRYTTNTLRADISRDFIWNAGGLVITTGSSTSSRAPAGASQVMSKGTATSSNNCPSPDPKKPEGNVVFPQECFNRFLK